MKQGTSKMQRVVVTRSPDAKFQAPYKCVVYVWVCSHTVNDEENSVVMVNTEPDERDDWSGTPLPFDAIVPIHLDKGQILYAITKNEAEMSMSVEPK